ncbi:MAG: hypothetical protein HY762_05845, partial [Planctomycetes bacterium]|nr:hypothetical protein [Planctomycetota bacterium]
PVRELKFLNESTSCVIKGPAGISAVWSRTGYRSFRTTAAYHKVFPLYHHCLIVTYISISFFEVNHLAGFAPDIENVVVRLNPDKVLFIKRMKKRIFTTSINGKFFFQVKVLITVESDRVWVTGPKRLKSRDADGGFLSIGSS